MSRIGSSLRVVRALVMVAVALAAGAILAIIVLDRQAQSDNTVRVIEVPYLGGSGGITTGRVIFVHDGRADDAELLAHELVHVCQWEQGRVEFLWDYTTEYVSNLAELKDSDQAYREISFEEQARAGESQCELDQYTLP